MFDSFQTSTCAYVHVLGAFKSNDSGFWFYSNHRYQMYTSKSNQSLTYGFGGSGIALYCNYFIMHEMIRCTNRSLQQPGINQGKGGGRGRRLVMEENDSVIQGDV